MKLKYDDIETGVRDYLKLLGRETNQNVICILTEMVILHSYSASENFNLLFAPKFLTHVNEYIQMHYSRSHCEFELMPANDIPLLAQAKPKEIPDACMKEPPKKRGRKKKGE